MTFPKTFTLSVLFLAITTSTHAEEKLRVLDGGLDGPSRYYAITCPDGNMSTVVVHFDLEKSVQILPEVQRQARVGTHVQPARIIKVCILPGTSSEECRPQWELEKAALASCPKPRKQ